MLYGNRKAVKKTVQNFHVSNLKISLRLLDFLHKILYNCAVFVKWLLIYKCIKENVECWNNFLPGITG